MSHKINSALPIIKHFMKKHPVPLHKFDEVFQTLRITLWKSINKQATTHQDWTIAHVFYYMARSDLKEEYWLESLITVPHKKLYDKQWKADNMPGVFWSDDNPDEVEDIFPSREILPEDEVILLEQLDSLSSKEKKVMEGRAKGLNFKEIGHTMGLKSEHTPLDIMKGIRAKLGTANYWRNKLNYSGQSV